MWRTVLFLILLNLLFAALIGVAVGVGHGQPLDAKVARLHLTDCVAPCWIGITPGLTTEDKARTLFDKVYPQHKPFFIAPNEQGGGLQAQTGLSVPSPSDLVPSILIGDLENRSGLGVVNSALMPRLGDVLMMWGLPTCMYPEAPDFWRLHYNTGKDGLSIIDVLMKGSRLSPTQPVYFLIFYRTPMLLGPRCSLEDTKQWIGFATLP